MLSGTPATAPYLRIEVTSGGPVARAGWPVPGERRLADRRG
jgi:hypothetical protein